MPGLHAKLAPSAAHRWIRCPGSIKLCADLPNESSDVADEGTIAHRALELSVKLRLPVDRFVGKELESHGVRGVVDKDMARYLEPIRRRLLFHQNLTIENKISLAPWLPDQFGTLDYGEYEREAGRITIIDLKYGQGVPVSPVENEQLMLYALGYWVLCGRPNDVEFDIVIEQPRNHLGGGTWRTTLAHLLDFAETARKAGEQALSDNGPIVPGEKQCRFCPAAKAGKCDVLNQEMNDVLKIALAHLDNPESIRGSALSPEDRANIIRRSDEVVRWINRLKTEALNEALSGRPLPGFKVVLGRKGNKTWLSEDDAAELLRDHMTDEDLFTRKLCSPTKVYDALGPKQAEKLVGHLISQRDGDPVLVPESDKRKPLDIDSLNRQTADEFEDIS